MRKYLALTVVLVTLLTACKSTSERSAGDATTRARGTAVIDRRAPGVTASSIKVGVPWVDLSSIKDAIQLDNGDFVTAFQAVFDDINARGGINGRKLEPVFAAVNPVGTAAAAAACTKLTQDDPVFVAVGFFLTDAVLCYVDTNNTAVVGGTMTPERLAKAKAPWFTTDAGSDLEVDVVHQFARRGDLDGKVAVVATAADERLLKEAVEPALRAEGIKPVSTAVLDAPVTDSNATNAQGQTIAERFKASGANKVLLVGQGIATTMLPGLAKTDYRPQLLSTNVAGAQTYTQSIGHDLTVMKGALSGGEFGPLDARLALGGPTKKCMDLQRNAGLVIAKPSEVGPGKTNQFVASSQACSQMALLVAILKKAGPTLNYGTFQTAGESLPPIVLPTYPDAWHFGPPPHSDGDQTIYIQKWDPSAAQFVPSGN